MNKSLTNYKLAQIRNIIGNDPHKSLEVLRECAEVVGLVSKADFAKIMAIPVRTVQYGCKSGQIQSLNISGDLYPCVNCNLKHNM